MPSHLRPALRLLLCAAMAAAAFAAAATAAQAGVTVIVQPPGQANPVPISTDDVTPDIVDQRYRIARPSGGSQEVVVSAGVSLLKLLTETNTDFGYATISLSRPDGSTLELTEEQVTDPRNQQVLYTDPQGVTHFIGPRQGNGRVAADDYFVVDETLSLVQQAESRLKVKIDPSRKKIVPGGTITFKAKVTGAEPGETVVYTWWMAGKRQRVGDAEYVQDFPEKDGVYKFSVAARIDGSGISATAVARITVGDPKKAKDEQVGDGDQDTGSDGGTGAGTGGYDSGGSSGYTPSYTPSYTPAPAPAPAPTPAPEPRDPPDIATSGTTVEGSLLTDTGDRPPSNLLESAARAAREGRQSDGAGEGAGVSEAALSIAGVLALLGFGAGIENRQGRLPRPRLPRRAA